MAYSSATPTEVAAAAVGQLEAAFAELSTGLRPHDAVGVEAAAFEAASAIAALLRGRVPAALMEQALRVSAKLSCLRAVASCRRATEDSGDIDPRPAAIIALILARPAWRCRQLPRLGNVPRELWAAYTSWIMAPVERFELEGDEARFAAHLLRHLEELGRWAQRNPGSACVRAAIDAYLTAVRLRSFLNSNPSLRRPAELHGRIMAARDMADRTTLPTTARANRKLRIVFVGSAPSAIPEFHRALDSHRFEVSAYVLAGLEEQTESSVVSISAMMSLWQHDNRRKRSRQLPATLTEQVEELRELAADVVVYAEDLALSGSGLTRLAARRLAPLQVAISPASTTTGLDSIDLFITGEASFKSAFAEEFSERLALVRGPGFTRQPMRVTAAPAEHVRLALGVPSAATLIVTAVPLAEATPGRMSFWVQLLRRVRHGVLVVQILDLEDGEAGAVEALGRKWDTELDAAGVPVERGVIMGSPVSSTDFHLVVAAGDLFLHGSGCADPDLLEAPLSSGVPVIARDGPSLRTSMAAGLLRSIGRDEQVVGDDESCLELVARLISDEPERRRIAREQQAALDGAPLYRDSLAAAEMYGFVFERAFDDLHKMGAVRFRKAAPLRLPCPESHDIEKDLGLARDALASGNWARAQVYARHVLQAAPAHTEGRHLAGRALLAGDRVDAALDYLLAAVHQGGSAALWYDLASALHRNHQTSESLQALETCLRLDTGFTDGWVMLIERAKAAGADQMAQDALAALCRIAPNDPRIPALEAEVIGSGLSL